MKLDENQERAVSQLQNGRILCGGVGSGKSRTALAYYQKVVSEGPSRPLLIITIAKKRDDHEWEQECAIFGITDATIDSWNNLHKYVNIIGHFVIFDEQKVTGSGAWVKAFYAITKRNKWILLSATPGDTWSDYIPVFVANGFYRNKTEFLRRHAVFNRYTSYPKIDRYVETERLLYLKKLLIVPLDYSKPTERHYQYFSCPYDDEAYRMVLKDRWNPYTSLPIKNAGELCMALRHIISSSPGRISALKHFIIRYPKMIVFYNFDSELEILRETAEELGCPFGEWNGHKHTSIPRGERWLYFVQYLSGGEGWECTETNVMLFYSQTYSYKQMEQAAGRIDRRNTPFKDLYYICLISDSSIDTSIRKCLDNKKDFNELDFEKAQNRIQNTPYNRRR